MDPMLLRTFQNQVLLECKFALLAADDLSEAVNQHDTTRIFYAIQNFLNAVGNISKALWGQTGSRDKERRALRDSIGISDDSVLQHVNMRDNYEHFDERIDRWWQQSSRHNYADLNIGTPSMISSLEETDMFRTFDPQTGDVIFWGQSFNVPVLIDEITRILPTVAAEAGKPYSESP